VIRIRYLTPGSLAGLVVKTAEEQMAARVVCKPPCEAFGNAHRVLNAKSQKKWQRR